MCGKEFIRPILKSGRLSRTTVCSEACAHSLKVQRSIESMQKLVAEGRQVPWQSRNIKSYAEKFFEQVLDTNNIVYKREVVVAHDKSNYFLDFVIETKNGLIDLEIDGKQHQYKERKQSDLVRDAYLTGLNYSVYRIPWNEITSETGKTIMKEKIDKFLVFYNSLI